MVEVALTSSVVVLLVIRKSLVAVVGAFVVDAVVIDVSVKELGDCDTLAPVENDVCPGMVSNDPPNAHLGYFSTIVKPTFNKNGDMRCINHPGIALVGPGLQAPML